MEILRAELEALMREHRFQYCCIGNDGHGGRDGRHDAATWAKLEREILTPNSGALIGRLVELLRPVRKIQRQQVGSYGLKHILEQHPDADTGYVSNGQAIAAALILGFSYKIDGPNAAFGPNKLDVERLRRARQ